MKFVIEYSKDRVFQNPGRNQQGRFLDTVSMSGNIERATVEAENDPEARKLFWEKYGSTLTIRNSYAIVSPTHFPEPHLVEIDEEKERVYMNFYQDGNPKEQRIELPFGAVLDILESADSLWSCMEEPRRFRNEDDEYCLVMEDGRKFFARDVIRDKMNIYATQVLRAALADIDLACYITDEKS